MASTVPSLRPGGKKNDVSAFLARKGFLFADDLDIGLVGPRPSAPGPGARWARLVCV
jgi:hypothetical protein